mgnify:CR=1 FL=1
MLSERRTRRRLAILSALKAQAQAVNSASLAEVLTAGGLPTSERTVRLYVREMSAEGLTATHGRRGATITEKGRAELGALRLLERVGMLSARIDQMSCRMTFDLATRSGTVIVNVTLAPRERLARWLGEIEAVFAAGYAVGELVALAPPGSRVGDLSIPAERVGFCTVCSVTLNGVLLKHGVPVRSRFGGLLDVRRGQPLRFAEMIEYEGTSIDPLALFIRAGMTDYLGAVRTGNGRIGAGFRELPAAGRDTAARVAERLEAIGMRTMLRLGLPGQSLLEIPVCDGQCGMIAVGGLNPAAVLEERGCRVESVALGGLLDYAALFHYSELRRRLMRL